MKTKKYTVIYRADEEGMLHCERENDGFNAFEILGMLENTKMQIVEMMHGKIEIPIENTKLSQIEKDRITIDFAIKNYPMSARLKSALKGYVAFYESKFLDEVEPDKMAKHIRNAGNYTKNELIELLNTLNIKQNEND